MDGDDEAQHTRRRGGHDEEERRSRMQRTEQLEERPQEPEIGRDHALGEDETPPSAKGGPRHGDGDREEEEEPDAPEAAGVDALEEAAEEEEQAGVEVHVLEVGLLPAPGKENSDEGEERAAGDGVGARLGEAAGAEGAVEDVD